MDTLSPNEKRSLENTVVTLGGPRCIIIHLHDLLLVYPIRVDRFEGSLRLST